MLRALPNNFREDSIYCHYPMTIPEENAKIMQNLGRYSDYNYDKPQYIPERINLTSYKNAKYILSDKKSFNVMWTEPFIFTMGKAGGDFMLSGDTEFHEKQRETMSKALYLDKWHQHVKDFYQWTTLRLLHEKSCKIAGINQVDLTREYVSNLINFDQI